MLATCSTRPLQDGQAPRSGRVLRARGREAAHPQDRLRLVGGMVRRKGARDLSVQYKGGRQAKYGSRSSARRTWARSWPRGSTSRGCCDRTERDRRGPRGRPRPGPRGRGEPLPRHAPERPGRVLFPARVRRGRPGVRLRRARREVRDARGPGRLPRRARERGRLRRAAREGRGRLSRPGRGECQPGSTFFHWIHPRTRRPDIRAATRRRGQDLVQVLCEKEPAA